MLSWVDVFLLLRGFFLISLFPPLSFFALKNRASSSESVALLMKSALSMISWHCFVLDLEGAGRKAGEFGCKIAFSRITCGDPTLVFCPLHSSGEVTETSIENTPPGLESWHAWIWLEVSWALEGNHKSDERRAVQSARGGR